MLITLGHTGQETRLLWPRSIRPLVTVPIFQNTLSTVYFAFVVICGRVELECSKRAINQQNIFTVALTSDECFLLAIRSDYFQETINRDLLLKSSNDLVLLTSSVEIDVPLTVYLPNPPSDNNNYT